MKIIREFAGGYYGDAFGTVLFSRYLGHYADDPQRGRDARVVMHG